MKKVGKCAFFNGNGIRDRGNYPVGLLKITNRKWYCSVYVLSSEIKIIDLG